MREEWEENQRNKVKEHNKDGNDDYDGDEWSEEVSTYFQRSDKTPTATPIMMAIEQDRSSDEDEKASLGDPAKIADDH
jgi:hypothetical protein